MAIGMFTPLMNCSARIYLTGLDFKEMFSENEFGLMSGIVCLMKEFVSFSEKLIK